MLQIKNLTKIYKPKKGVPVTALDHVSLTLPERGMIFLLGKSGSGKSTLLNLLGGLDSFDEGEIIISGQKTEKFRQSDFDSYRNTLVGFIFQEYNVLEEFTVGANIALALELQGKKATDAEIGSILERVDLAGFGARRPNELSGGQRQRVAIARALVKNPKIIMADEPTGALDSSTGRQVLDTLKKLSEEKLVIVVSHDREFAEKYADRLITLSDGKVISDQVFENTYFAFKEKGLTFGEDEIRISSEYRLTEEDRIQINDYLSALSEGKEVSFLVQKSARQKRDIKEEEILVSYEKVKLIPSKLPAKPAFRIGAGALKHKKIRLAFTIFLSFIAFGLFGLADTFGAYDHITTCVNSILDSKISYASVRREEKVWYENGNKKEYYMTDGGRISDEEIEKIQAQTGVLLEGVFMPYGQDLSFSHLYDQNAEFTKSDFQIYPYAFNGFAKAEEEALSEMGHTLLAGRMPEAGKGEIVITSYACETFMIGGFAAEAPNGKIEYEKIRKVEDMLGKKITLSENEYTVVGVVDSGFDLERYRSLTEEKKDESTADLLISYALSQELAGIREYSLAQVIFIHEKDLSEMAAAQPTFREARDGYFSVEWYEKDKKDDWYGIWSENFGTLKDTEGYSILWVDGEKDILSDNEIVLSLGCVLENLNVSLSPEVYDEKGYVDYKRLTEEDKK
ncbi:MAG: ABC transporter ATP-binding protein, partial [Clostridia bacterium]|nr:ABC transporter ATP-binding protein [Clostridia bacterium]